MLTSAHPADGASPCSVIAFLDPKGTCVDGAASRIPVPAPDCAARTLKTACREVRDLARFPQSSRAVSENESAPPQGFAPQPRQHDSLSNQETITVNALDARVGV